MGRRGRGAWPVREQPSRYGGGTTWNMEREEVLEAAVLSALLASANVRRPSRLHWAANVQTCGHVYMWGGVFIMFFAPGAVCVF